MFAVICLSLDPSTSLLLSINRSPWPSPSPSSSPSRQTLGGWHLKHLILVHHLNRSLLLAIAVSVSSRSPSYLCSLPGSKIWFNGTQRSSFCWRVLRPWKKISWCWCLIPISSRSQWPWFNLSSRFASTFSLFHTLFELCEIIFANCNCQLILKFSFHELVMNYSRKATYSGSDGDSTSSGNAVEM